MQSRRLAARDAGLPFDLTDEWAKARWTGCCELSGIEFQKNPNGHGPWPFSCTIDQIIPGKGYTQDNSRFVLMGCNGLKGIGTDAQVFFIAKALASRAPLDAAVGIDLIPDASGTRVNAEFSVE